jgi:hypothetical protein
MEKEQLIVGFILTILGGLNVVRPYFMVRLQVWTQRVIMGAQYVPSQRTFKAIRIIGVILMIMGLINLAGGIR